ncbi:hypothetical protein GOV12_00055 [Candidatus Pacearchaeota archaeon]|nr:hypothetical protein [Candidatus Pacearchaeota archaeon]
MNLHETILYIFRENCKLEEHKDFPEGISTDELSEISKAMGNKARFIFVPADLVPESATSRRIAGTDNDLNSRYVVYRGFRRGTGHDPTYG